MCDKDSTRRTVTRFTCMSVFDKEGVKINFNAHPHYHGAPWYDWAWVDYIVMCPSGETGEEFYPFFGFVQTEGAPIHAIVHHCSQQLMNWSTVEHEFFVPFVLGTEFEELVISVTLPALTEPIGIIPNYGAEDKWSFFQSSIGANIF